MDSIICSHRSWVRWMLLPYLSCVVQRMELTMKRILPLFSFLSQTSNPLFHFLQNLPQICRCQELVRPKCGGAKDVGNHPEFSLAISSSSDYYYTKWTPTLNLPSALESPVPPGRTCLDRPCWSRCFSPRSSPPGLPPACLSATCPTSWRF